MVSGNAENKQTLFGAEGGAKERDVPDQAFSDKLPGRSPPNKVERTAINKAIKRTRAWAPRVEMRIEDGTRRLYPCHSDEDGNLYRLADTFGTRSLQFVNWAMQFTQVTSIG